MNLEICLNFINSTQKHLLIGLLQLAKRICLTWYYNNCVSSFMKKKYSSNINVVLAGGLGNQLFTFVAGLYLARLQGCNLRAYSAAKSKAYGIHGSTIERFDTSPWGEIVDTQFNESLSKRVQAQIISKTSSKSKLLRYATYYRSDTIGFDSRLESLSPPITVKGYFQTYRYLMELFKLEPEFDLTLNKPSQEFTEISKTIQKKPSTIIHLRLGDYRLHQNSTGILHPDYYRKALENLQIRGTQTLVFSDEINEAHKMLSPILPKEVVWINQNYISAEESMALMWQGTQFIIGNSTFGYWGAIMAKSKEIIVAPSKWFKGYDDPIDLIPRNWLRIESKWQ
jgi:hypothetical protein